MSRTTFFFANLLDSTSTRRDSIRNNILYSARNMRHYTYVCVPIQALQCTLRRIAVATITYQRPDKALAICRSPIARASKLAAAAGGRVGSDENRLRESVLCFVARFHCLRESILCFAVRLHALARHCSLIAGALHLAATAGGRFGFDENRL